jgi:hypothetical protein
VFPGSAFDCVVDMINGSYVRSLGTLLP